MNDITRDPALASGQAAPAEHLDAFWMPFTANRQFKAAPSACWRAPRACTTTRPRAGRSSTRRPGCGA